MEEFDPIEEAYRLAYKKVYHKRHINFHPRPKTREIEESGCCPFCHLGGCAMNCEEAQVEAAFNKMAREETEKEKEK